jgi:hypothetical protein
VKAVVKVVVLVAAAVVTTVLTAHIKENTLINFEAQLYLVQKHFA